MVPTSSDSIPHSTHLLAEPFIRQGLYLRNWSPRTADIYRRAIDTLRDVPLTKAGLADWLIALRAKGVSTGGVNLRIRSINSFLTWLHEEGHVGQRLKLKVLPKSPTPIDLLRDQDVHRLLAFRPHSKTQRRAWTLIVLLLDTGLRIDEALGLERRHVHLDDLMLRVLGKGNKERLVPISKEARKHLFRFLQTNSGRFVFGTRDDVRLRYRNAYRDISRLCAKLKLTGATHPHAFRHYFAVSYVRAGGDIYRLSRILGHTSISTTQLYLRSMGIEHLREGHHSPLTR